MKRYFQFFSFVVLVFLSSFLGAAAEGGGGGGGAIAPPLVALPPGDVFPRAVVPAGELMHWNYDRIAGSERALDKVFQVWTNVLDEGALASIQSFLLDTFSDFPEGSLKSLKKKGTPLPTKEEVVLSALRNLQGQDVIVGDSNITASKTFQEAVRGDRDLSQYISEALFRITGDEWMVAMSTVATGKFRKGGPVLNTQTQKSTQGDVRSLMTEEGNGVAELDGTFVAINLTRFAASHPAEMQGFYTPGRGYHFQNLAFYFFPIELNPNVLKEDHYVPSFRVALRDRVANYKAYGRAHLDDPTSVTVSPSCVFTSAPDTGEIGYTFLDHAVLRFRYAGVDYIVLNFGSVIGAKWKQWGVIEGEKMRLLTEMDERFIGFFREGLFTQNEHGEPLYTGEFWDLMKGVFGPGVTSDTLDGTCLQGSLLEGVLPPVQVESTQALFADVFERVLDSKEFDALLKHVHGLHDDSEESSAMYAALKEDVTKHLHRKIQSSVVEGVKYKALVKVAGEVFTSCGLGSPVGGFDISHVPPHAQAFLTPKALYTRAAIYAREHRSVILASEALMTGFDSTRHGSFSQHSSKRGKGLPHNWSSLISEDPKAFSFGPKGATDLGFVLLKGVAEFESDDQGVPVLLGNKREAQPEENCPVSIVNPLHQVVRILNIHGAGDGPKKGVEKRAELLEVLEFVKAQMATGSLVLFPKVGGGGLKVPAGRGEVLPAAADAKAH